MTGPDLLRLAAGLRIPLADSMAAAVGWPTVEECRAGRAGRVAWSSVATNGALTLAADPDWLQAVRLGLAEADTQYDRPLGSVYERYIVTPLGRRVLQLRLRAEIWGQE